MHTVREILAVLDRCAGEYTFPMLDNGHVYLAATRLALFRSAEDWAMTIEVFGSSPRAGVPDNHVHTFGSRLVRDQSRSDFETGDAWTAHLRLHPNDEHHFVHPIDDGEWNEHGDELVAQGVPLTLRGRTRSSPTAADAAARGIALENAEELRVYELCRLLAAVGRDEVLATVEERRSCVPVDLVEILVLEEWHHPDLVAGELPSDSRTFQDLARVLETGDVSAYSPRDEPNTHWTFWPEGGSL